ncbi:3-hydroxyacyl-ACP dehydratase FabZ family protein [Bradyrhizobium sp. LHD-71]|uniref:3-hydroxyacyl-ACP dehydratase FabZ family protein n=1 Tax=Bradyrhizobium sp. LHD-71 TaxID=3072141 RepID=UPI00280D4850|nr:3-hydroxyacyl-ACP dehydratase FabZ family protein [Bradyrhizobium sp. LHD-71]MDQ8728664.1 3-hydroxyacyl-ACP dehydratase FabZ family protein [Bradyrhizobium sp. LHD-71]
MHLEYFQLIDRIASLDLEGRSIKVEAEVPLTSTIFEGHFPGRPLMPGVLLIEAMAQASGFLLIASMNFERMPFLAAVKDAKMRSFVQPGAKLEIAAKVTHEGSGFAMTIAEITIAGKKTCNASLTFSHVPFPNEEFRRHMATVAKRIGLPQSAGTQD